MMEPKLLPLFQPGKTYRLVDGKPVIDKAEATAYGQQCYAAGVAAERERRPLLVLVNGLPQTPPESDVPMMLAVNTSAKALSYVDDWGPDGVKRVEIQPGGFVWVRRRSGD